LKGIITGVKFECCYCHAIFPAGERIDGFKKVYRTGFLCPHCGRNIKDNLLVPKQRLDACQKKWLNRIFWLSVPFILTTFFDRNLQIRDDDISLSTLFFGLFLVSSLLIILFVPCTRRAGTFMTEPVRKP
jgi:hypothetical protein